MSHRFSTRGVENLELFSIDDRLNHARHAMLSIVSTVRFDIPDALLSALGIDVAAASGELRFAAAVKLYELGRLSSGAAAQLAGVPRVGFLAKLGEFGATAVNQDEADIAGELERA